MRAAGWRHGSPGHVHLRVSFAENILLLGAICDSRCPGTQSHVSSPLTQHKTSKPRSKAADEVSLLDEDNLSHGTNVSARGGEILDYVFTA